MVAQAALSIGEPRTSGQDKWLDPRARQPRRHSLHRRGGRVFAPRFRVVFADGGSAAYNNHELAPLLATTENDSRLWFYDFSTDWLAGIYRTGSRTSTRDIAGSVAPRLKSGVRSAGNFVDKASTWS